MSLTSIISAIGNNNSIYPLLIRDCGIENPTKVILTYKQNKDESPMVARLATRERFIDEYAVSSVWLGCIPLIDKVSNYFIRKVGYNPDINLKLLRNNGLQNIEQNIKNFKGQVPEYIIKELEKTKSNKAVLEKFVALKFLASTTIPIALMGFIIPKYIFASSEKRIKKAKNKSQNQIINCSQTNSLQKLSDFMNNKKISFRGLISNLANFSTVEKMAVTDGGYALGRLGTARNNNEKIDIGFKMVGMMLLNYVAPKYIQRLLDGATNKISNLNVSLDPKMFENKEFLEKIKTNSLKLPNGLSEKEILEFIDKNPNSIFVKFAKEFNKVKMLDNGIRDPRFYVEIKELVNLKKDMEIFAKRASLDISKLEQFAKRAKTVKSVNILSNIILSSFLLAYGLPKAQFAFRELVTGSKLEPGLAPAVND